MTTESEHNKLAKDRLKSLGDTPTSGSPAEPARPRRATETATSASAAHDIVTGEKPVKAKRPPRKLSKVLRAAAHVEAAIDGLATTDKILVLRFQLEQAEAAYRGELSRDHPLVGFTRNLGSSNLNSVVERADG